MNWNSLTAPICFFAIFIFGIIAYNRESNKIDYIRLRLNNNR